MSAIVAAPGVDEARLLAVPAAIERRSEHPLASAVVAAAEARGLATSEPDDVTAEPGRGVIGILEGRVALAGRAVRLADYGVEETATLAAARERLESEGRTVIGVALGGESLGLIAVSDEMKPGAPEAIAALGRDGLAVWLLTGDHERTARQVASLAGIAPSA